MQYQSHKLGRIQYQEKDILHFETGLFGFEGMKRYVLVDGDENTHFKYLQSLEDNAITFVVCDPTNFIDGYELIIEKSDIKDLNLEDTKDLASVVIVTVPSKHEDISLNLLGPLVINVKNRMAKQVISKHDSYTTKHYLLRQNKAKVFEGGTSDQIKKIG